LFDEPASEGTRKPRDAGDPDAPPTTNHSTHAGSGNASGMTRRQVLGAGTMLAGAGLIDAIGSPALANRKGVGVAGPATADHVPRLRGRAAMVAARRRFFGHSNVDPRTGAVRSDRVILSWFGVTNFAMAIRGHVVLLDAWVSRGQYSGYVPTSPDELAQLRPRLIFIGHGHFDHAGDAAPLALATGARLVGSAEHCADLKARIPGASPRCKAVVPAGAPPGTVAKPRLLRGVNLHVAVMKHLHSAGTPPSGEYAPVPLTPTDTIALHPPTEEDKATLQRHLGDAEGGSLLYRFRVGKFVLVWHDTSGPLVDEGPALIPVLRALRPVDVEVGSIGGFNLRNNGFRDPLTYTKALRPRIFVPAHHDDWFPPTLSTRASHLEQPFRQQFRQAFPTEGPRIRYIRDPEDYVRPKRLTFRVS
jgi:L-ascorbate metabolism protein UlaG (beta-lactamase superfamily)